MSSTCIFLSERIPLSNSSARLVPFSRGIGECASVCRQKGDVGNAGVGKQMPADNQYVVARAALCKQLVEDLAVGAFVGVADVVCLYQCQ